MPRDTTRPAAPFALSNDTIKDLRDSYPYRAGYFQSLVELMIDDLQEAADHLPDDWRGDMIRARLSTHIEQAKAALAVANAQLAEAADVA